MNTNKIKEFKLNGLWDLHNIHLNFKNNVTILIGKNGSGKSTVLKALTHLLEKKNLPSIHFKNNSIMFEDGREITYEKKSYNIGNTNGEKDTNLDLLMDMLNNLKKGNNEIVKTLDETNENHLDLDINKTMHPLNLPKVIKFSTFDMELKNKQLINSFNEEDNEPKTELDLILYKLINDFKLYQLKLKNILEKESKKIDNHIKELSSSQTSTEEDFSLLKNLVNKKEDKINEIYKIIVNFRLILSSLFNDTNKEFDLDENNSLIFKVNDTIITPYDLSSGEKQILAILLNVVLTEGEFCYLIMDEPEISLHVEWQTQFIDNLIKLNNNMQIIIATHSPAIVTKGWMKNVIKMSSITKEIS